MIEAQLSEAVKHLHLTAVETLNRLLKTETDSAELRRLLAIAVRVRHPAAERPKPRTSPEFAVRSDNATLSPCPEPTPAANPLSRHRIGVAAREHQALTTAITAAAGSCFAPGTRNSA